MTAFNNHYHEEYTYEYLLLLKLIDDLGVGEVELIIKHIEEEYFTDYRVECIREQVKKQLSEEF